MMNDIVLHILSSCEIYFSSIFLGVLVINQFCVASFGLLAPVLMNFIDNKINYNNAAKSDENG